MISNDLEIQLVGLERQTSLLTRLVPISIAVAVVSQMLVDQYVGQPVVLSNWFLYREVSAHRVTVYEDGRAENAAHAHAPG